MGGDSDVQGGVGQAMLLQNELSQSFSLISVALA